MTIATVVTSMKDEAPYILEWVAYHKAIGFDRIVVLANDSTDGTHEMLQRLHDMGVVTYCENKVGLGEKPHARALKIANASDEVRSSDFVMVLDADEFLVVKSAPHTVDYLIRKMDELQADRMVIPWRLFGSSQNIEFCDQPVITRFTRSMDVSSLPKVGVKTFFRRDDISRAAIHFPKAIMKGGKALKTGKDARWIDAGGRTVNASSLTWNGGRNVIHRDMAEVAHFMIKSLDEYLLKIFRGDGLMNSNRHGIDYWRGADHDETSDLILADTVAGFQEEYERLKADPELAELHCRAIDLRYRKLEKILANQDVQLLKSILLRSTSGTITSNDVAESRRLVMQMAPPPVVSKLLEEDRPVSVLLSITTAGLADAGGIAARLSAACRRSATLFWKEKDFAKRPISSLVAGLEPAQKQGRELQLACRWFDNYARAQPTETWPLDHEILIVLTRDPDNLIAGFPAYVATSRSKHLDRPDRSHPAPRTLFTGKETPDETNRLIAKGKVADPRETLRRFKAAEPAALVLNLDHPQDVDAALQDLADKGPHGAAAARLLRAALSPDEAGQEKANSKQQAVVALRQPAPHAAREALKLFWFRRNAGAGINFGDDLGPLVVRHLIGRDVEWARAGDCDLATIGSILSQVSRDAARTGRQSDLLVWGSGLMETDPAPLHPSLVTLAVRGELTRDTLQLGQLPLGDPGIFAADVVPAGRRSHRWGIVPHYSHRNSREIRALAKERGCILIDPTDEPAKVLRDISACEAILSSSLHGLIVADSYNLPCCWLNIASHKSHEFKFADYCSGVERWPFDEVCLEDAPARLQGDAQPDAFAISSAIKERLAKVLLDAL
ncbi:glycosyltransferase family 2 protein [Paracoccus benzoatiresistens]|uniref:Glycosyltransferase family 2 protein n=1 Tax=Paracoccus benzoatiresistens TaxID=2997341 RepID=A0ABT4J1R9_9RHOB|nr:glycosyltransferase family 2 protein [Paracoccus sp. EF6]MCZ0961033.1 glycosyltransferase family 2 protein [Paracoccus sp. EF6]